MLHVISANRLSDGIVVYAGRDGAWAERLDESKVFANAAETEAGLLLAQNDAKRNLVLDPCLVEVMEEGGELRAVTLRESIRAGGPTIDFLPPARAFAYETEPLLGHRATQGVQPLWRMPRPGVSRDHELIGAGESRDGIAG